MTARDVPVSPAAHQQAEQLLADSLARMVAEILPLPTREQRVARMVRLGRRAHLHLIEGGKQ